jgi:hypothetical protein
MMKNRKWDKDDYLVGIYLLSWILFLVGLSLLFFSPGAHQVTREWRAMSGVILLGMGLLGFFVIEVCDLFDDGIAFGGFLYKVIRWAWNFIRGQRWK